MACIIAARAEAFYTPLGERLRGDPVPEAREAALAQNIRSARAVRRPAIPDELSRRVPPGQFVTPRWPVLHQGEIPGFDPTTWDFRVWGLVETPLILTWGAFRNLPVSETQGDLHCVTRWTTLDHEWQGVQPRTLFDRAGLHGGARFVLLHGEGDYTANLPLDVFLGDDVVLATHHEGTPLAPQHGAPLRAVIPGRYAWKSVKWLRGIEVLGVDQPGFWEGFGYSNSADPWREERFETL